MSLHSLELAADISLVTVSALQQSRRIVFLGNLPPPVTEMLIFEYFRSFGELEDISLHTKKPDQK